jgi:hypothetical protein
MSDALVTGVLRRLPRQELVFCGVPDYQGGVRAALQNAGFQPSGRQVRLVRYTAVFVRRSAAELASVLEKGAEMAAPVAQASQRSVPPPLVRRS